MKRRSFVYKSILAAGSVSILGFRYLPQKMLMTVKGPVNSREAGFVLEHEHVLVDFIGAANYDRTRWDHNEVTSSVIPFLKELKKMGCDTLIEFTPAYLGRDPLLLKTLSQQSGINIITNTGYYGAGENKFLPALAYKASASDLADHWIKEFQDGIDGTDIRPGFIKISVSPGSLTDLHKKLVQAAAITHLATGLTIASHTGPAIAAFEQLEALRLHDVHPSAFVWVHAQNEDDTGNYVKAAQLGAWLSFDGVQESNIEKYVRILQSMKNHDLLQNVLISQDAGWYEPGKPWEGPKRKYTAIFKHLIPQLKIKGFSSTNIEQLFKTNPTEAFSIRVRRHS